MNIWHDISPERIQPENFTAVIEIPKGGKNKYEMDKETGLLRLDRVLYTATHYPANYGFIPRTYADDGDPLDVLVLCQESIVPLTLVQCYPIGVIQMVDDEKSSRCRFGIPPCPGTRIFPSCPATPLTKSSTFSRCISRWRERKRWCGKLWDGRKPLKSSSTASKNIGAASAGSARYRRRQHDMDG